MQDEPWYGVKCIFRHDDMTRDEAGTVYEERVVIVRAASFEDALAEAEAEAGEYVEELDATYLGFADIFHLADKKLGERTEVYSLMRTSDLAENEFITRYFDDGTEHRQTFEEPADHE